MGQTECGCMCHTDEHPRYLFTSGIVVCDWCLGNVAGWGKGSCETVRAEQEAEEQAVKLEYMKGKNHAET